MTDTDPIKPEVVSPPSDPGAFGPGSFAPAVDSLSLKERLKQSSPDTKRVSGEMQGVKRGPGRPPGSRNRPKTEPPENTRPSAADLVKEREAKRKRADQLAGQITGELNDTLMRLLMSQGVPPHFLYTEGNIPAAVSKNQGRYTELGGRLAVDGFAASMVGAFIVEFESSDVGGQIVAKTTGGPVGLVVKGLVAGACVIGYLSNVRKTMEQLKPIADAYKEYQKNQKQNNKQPGGLGNGQ